MASRAFRRVIAPLAVLLACALPMTGMARAESRIALVVGNGAYAAVTPLDNAGSDARLIAGVLTEQGFDVTLLTDATQIELTRAIGQFGRALREGGPETTGLFYYAGHGVQSFGANFLVPVDATLTDAADLSLVAVPAESILQQMNSASNRTNIMILDACRDNPFQAIPDMGDNGLAEMKAPTGTFLAYSTAPGDVALDGLDGNSPFTRALSAQIPAPGMPIEQVFREVRVKVLEATNGAQTPWDTSSLTSEFFFAAAPVLSDEDLAAQQLWTSVRGTRDPVQIMLFLRGYPDSAFAEEARALLTEAMAAELQADPAPVAEVPAPDARESGLIEAARASGLAADYEAYLAAFPTGTYSELARLELATLASAAAAAAVAPLPEPVVVAPEPAPAAIATLDGLTFTSPFPQGDADVAGKSLEQLITGTPLYPPIDGIPEELWKGQVCSNCHEWTRAALCDQAKTYVAQSGERALAKPHPYGGVFKQGLRAWGAGDCP